MSKLRLDAVTALCVTNRSQFVPNILRQWVRTGAPSLVVIIDFNDSSRDVLTAFHNASIRKIAGINYQPKITPTDPNIVVEWDNVKVVAALTPRKTIGDCRNLAIRYCDTPYFTWLDDDDLQRRHRVPLVIARAGSVVDSHVLVRGGQPLLDAHTGQIRTRPKNLSWLEGIYFKPDVRPFPSLSMSEDYHWMTQFAREDCKAKRLSARETLAVHVKHAWNTSDVRKLSMAPEFWQKEGSILEPCWGHAMMWWKKDLDMGLFVQSYIESLHEPSAV